jgi:hypothetical protein
VGEDAAVGLAVRGGAGMRYYIWDWFGLSLELGLSLGRGSYADSYPASHNYAVGDVALGVEAQFE